MIFSKAGGPEVDAVRPPGGTTSPKSKFLSSLRAGEILPRHPFALAPRSAARSLPSVHHFVALPLPGQEATAGADPQHAIAIKRWARECLRLPHETVVTVNEYACRDLGCPLLETVITVFGEGLPRTWKLTRPRIAVTKMMVQQTLATPPAT